MSAMDVIRFAVFAEAGAALSFMVGTNVLAFKVLRPPRRLGFLWWHVTSQSIATLLLTLIAVERVAGTLGDPPTWRTTIVFIGLTLMLVAQVIIYSVERQRLIARRAGDKQGDQALARALAELDEG